MKAAKGSMDCKQRKIAVAFKPDLFKRISAIAVANRRSFREQVNLLCETALYLGKYDQ